MEDREHSEVVFENCDASNRSLFDVAFHGVVFRNARFAGTQMRRTTFRDAVVIDSDFSVADWSGATLQRMQISGSKLSGLVGVGGRFEDVLFQRCKMHFSLFPTASFRRCRFEECDMVDTTFEGAKLEDVVFAGCQLRSVNFMDSQLKDVDWRGSEIDGVQIALSQLRGVTINTSQTAAIAAMTPVTIRDRDSDASGEAPSLSPLVMSSAQR